MVIITSGVKDMQAVLNLVWDKLLPAMKSSPLAADDEAGKNLEHRLQGLSLHPQGGSGSPAVALGKMYVFSSNDRKLEAISLQGGGKDGDMTLVMHVGGVEQKIVCGHGGMAQGSMGPVALAAVGG